MVERTGKGTPLLCLGAGASAALGFPPTKPFVEKLLAQIPETTTLEGRLLRSILQARGVEDVEHVLEILNFITAIANKGIVKAFFERLTISESVFGNIPYGTLGTASASLREQIKTEVFRTYSWKPQIGAKLKLYDALFEALSAPVLDVFTTNYDRVMEEYAHSNEEFTLRDGFVLNDRQRVFQWEPKSMDSVEKNVSDTSRLLRLYKLHGSLDWRKKKNGGIEQVGPEEQIGVGGHDSYEANLLIYPGGKTEPTIEPFQWLYNQFHEKLKASNICLVIGFSFRDEVLNRFFLEFIERKGSELIAVSPSATKKLEGNLIHNSVQDPRYEGRLIPIDKPFEELTMSELKQVLHGSRSRHRISVVDSTRLESPA